METAEKLSIIDHFSSLTDRNFSKSVGGDEKVRDTGKNLCYAQGR